MVAGALYGGAAAGGGGAVVWAGAGSGVLHASLEPQASMLFRLEKLVGAGFGFGGADGTVLERLNAEYEGTGAGAGALATEVGRGAGAGPDRSNKSPMVELAAGGGGLALVVGVAEVKSPKSPNPLDIIDD